MNLRQIFFSTALLASAVILPQQSEARTKLVTLPERAELVVNLENPHLSLLTESREIPLQEGTNLIDFSWQGVNLDQSSILLTPLSNSGDGESSTKVINVNFPPGESALTWEVFSPEAHTETFQVSYLLYNINRFSTYRMVVNEDETEAIFQQYFQMQNYSGERLEESAIRLVNTDDLTRSIESGETRRFLVKNLDSVPIQKLFISRPGLHTTSNDDGEMISMVYEIENNESAGLGANKMQPGKARLFGKDPSGSSIFLGEDYLPETAVGEKAQLALGTVKDILFKRRIVSDKQVNQRRNNNNRLILFDREVELRYEIENFKDKESVLRVVESFPPDAEILGLDGSNIEAKRISGNEYEINITLDPRPDNDKEVPTQEVTFRYRVANVIP